LGAVIDRPYSLEQILQRKLHDARVVGVSQLAEERAREFITGIRLCTGSRARERVTQWRPVAVRDVINLPPELKMLTFLQAERPHQSYVEIEVAGQYNLSGTGVPNGP